MNQIHHYQKALRELVKTGGVTDPDLAARIEAGWHPGVELAVMSVRPDLPDPIKTVILKVLLENTVVSATDRARLDAAVDSPTTISISIAGWAAGHGGPSAVDITPKAIDVPAIVDYTQADRAEIIALARRSPNPSSPLIKKWSCAPMAAASCDPHLSLSQRNRRDGNRSATSSIRTLPVMSRGIEHA